jgi:aromatic-L-amino-acid/L-tryptophan decarboxylase
VERPAPVTDLDWDYERARAFTDELVEIWTELLASLRNGPVVPPNLTQETVQDAVALDVPDEPMPTEALVSHLREAVLDNSLKSGHPAHLAYITGTGTVPGAAADLLASGLNANAGGWLLAPAATEIELQLTRWFAGLLDLPETAGGIIVAGGGVANFIALKAARDAVAGLETREHGVREPLAIYCSEDAHVTVDRAADMLGLGTGAVRHVDLGMLEEEIAADRAAGVRPAIVVGTAGTTATGVIEPLEELAEVASRHGLWFHVDAAYGGPAMLADDLRPLFAGIERADSIAFDPHKWLYTPQSGGCVVVRDLELMRRAFDVDYVAYVVKDEDHTDWGVDLGRHSPNFSRGFWALKVWVSLLAHGRTAYGRRISHDAALARYLGERVEESDEFELMTPVGLSITCFRYVPTDLTASGPRHDEPARDAYLDELNNRLMTAIQLDGRVYCSNAVLEGRFCLRSCIVNYRTEAEDMDALLDVASELGGKLDVELRPEALR